MRAQDRGCLFGVVGALFLGWLTVGRGCSAVEKAQQEQVAQTQRDQAAAIAQDERERQKKIDDAAEVERWAKEAIAGRTTQYAAMTPTQRVKEIGKLCPKISVMNRRTVQQIIDDFQPCADEDGLTALRAAAADTKEQTSLNAAIERARAHMFTGGRSAPAAASERSTLCCDGTPSPSCMCGGSQQGCCSHHGGVCGCE